MNCTSVASFSLSVKTLENGGNVDIIVTVTENE